MAKRIVLDLQPCCGNRSGVGMYTFELARRLASDDTLSFSGNLFNRRGREDGSEWRREIALPLHECRWLPGRVYRLLGGLTPLPYQRFFGGESDLTVFFNYIVPPHIRGKVVTTIHDVTYLRYPETVRARTLYNLRLRLRRSVRRSDRIVTGSEFTKREMIELLHIPPEKISVVPNAAVFSDAEAALADVERKYGFDAPYILYVGTVEPRKNLVRLIRAFERLKAERSIPHTLVLAGGSGWKNEEIYQAARSSPYAGAIRFTGYITEAEKTCLYRHADVFAFPSLYEGFGIPPLEAMHWGCPVVAANAASLPEVVGDAAVLVDPLDEADLAAGLWRVLSDAGLAASLVEKGKRQAEKYSWEDSAEKLKEICRRVLNE